METFTAAVVSGLGTGAVYALLAVGFVIIYRATDVINFAQPALMILGAYASSAFVSRLGLPF
jgi:branched-chain amino acid transport system permease protein